MKFSTVAILSCAVASAAAVPVQGTSAGLEARWISPLDAIAAAWRKSQSKDDFEDKLEKIEDDLDDEHFKEEWKLLRNGEFKAYYQLRQKNNKVEKELRKEHRKQIKEWENKHQGETRGVFWGTTEKGQKPAGNTPEVKATVEPRGLPDLVGTWRKGSKAEDDLERLHKQQREALKAKHKAEMEKFKSTQPGWFEDASARLSSEQAEERLEDKQEKEMDDLEHRQDLEEDELEKKISQDKQDAFFGSNKNKGQN